MRVDFWEDFKNLDSTRLGQSCSSVLIINRKHSIFLCKNEGGHPFFIIKAPSPQGRPSRKLRYVTFEFDKEFRVELKGDTIQGAFIKLSCDEQEELWFRVFIEAVCGVLRDVDEDALLVIDALIDLFSRQASSQRLSAVGLWGELAYLSAQDDPNPSVLAWHVNPDQAHDFVYKSYAVEVKSTTMSERRHHFSLAQVLSAQKPDRLCSIRLEASDSGETIFDLANLIDRLCTDSIRSIFWAKLNRFLSNLDHDIHSLKFSRHRAITSIVVYNLCDLSHPVIGTPKIGSVERVRFELLLPD